MSMSFTLEQMERYATAESRRLETYFFIRNTAGVARGVYWSPVRTLDHYSFLCSEAEKPGFLSGCLSLSFDPAEHPTYEEYELYVRIDELKVHIRTLERDNRKGLLDDVDFKNKRSDAVRRLKALLMKVEF